MGDCNLQATVKALLSREGLNLFCVVFVAGTTREGADQRVGLLLNQDKDVVQMVFCTTSALLESVLATLIVYSH